MIQRIQSVYLFVAAVLAVCLFCFPYAEVTVNGTLFTITACHLSPAVEMLPASYTLPFALSFRINDCSLPPLSVAAMLPLASVTLLAAVLCLIALFKYSNRTVQMKISKVAIYLQIVILVTMIAYFWGLSRTPNGGEMTFNVNFRLPMVFPVINIILLVLAYRGIKKDDDLVKSADRLR